MSELRKKILARLPRSSRWYTVTNKAGDGGPAQIRIYEEIGWFGITEEDFARDLAEITADEIEVQISSPGGDVFAGIAIYNALRTHPARITTRVDSLAASIASVIVQAGDRRIMVSASQQMIHPAWGFAIGPAPDMREMADLLDKQTDVLAGIYAERSGKPAEHWRTLMDAETWFTAEEAVEAGLADEILKPAVRPEARAQEPRFVDQAASVVAEVEELVVRAQEVITFRVQQGKPPLSDDALEAFDRLKAAHERLTDAVASHAPTNSNEAQHEYLRFVALNKED